MQLTRAKKIPLASLIIVLLLSGLLLARYFSIDSSASEREQLLQLIPAGASAVIYLDADELRASSLLAKFYAWSALGSPDSEYSQFVQDTGFSYERDLKRIAIAISNQGATSNVFAVADGKFDRKRIESFLRRNGKSSQQGRWTVFQLNTLSNERQMSLAFLSDSRIAIFDSGNSSAPLASAAKDPGRAEWSERFERLAGTPFFVVIRQDSTVQDALNAAAPGGLRSPQLSALLSQLQWLSISGKPDGDQLRVVAEGECPSPATVSQLSELLQGLLLLAQNGLNDPQLRQKMNPEERDAYLEMIKSADIQRIDRGQWKSVRVVLAITPKFLDVARAASMAPPRQDGPTQATLPSKSTKAAGQKTQKKK